jgi:hypothetical protein
LISILLAAACLPEACALCQVLGKFNESVCLQNGNCKACDGSQQSLSYGEIMIDHDCETIKREWAAGSTENLCGREAQAQKI